MCPYNPITALPKSNKGHWLGNLILTASLLFSNVSIVDYYNRNTHHVGNSPAWPPGRDQITNHF